MYTYIDNSSLACFVLLAWLLFVYVLWLSYLVTTPVSCIGSVLYYLCAFCLRLCLQKERDGGMDKQKGIQRKKESSLYTSHRYVINSRSGIYRSFNRVGKVFAFVRFGECEMCRYY
jgi:hypothetical protein